MIRCCSCLIPDTRPDTAFVDGECSACRNFAQRSSVDWDARMHQFESILEGGRNSSGFDCIVPSSGGKDSHYQVLRLIELGAKPLVVTASTCYLTPIGRKNIDNLSRYATTIEITPNRSVRAKLNRAGLSLVGDISWPEHLAIFSLPFKASVQFGIPLIFYGESPQREYGCPPGAEEAMLMTRRWVNEFGGLLGLRLNDLVGYEGISARDIEEYRWPVDDDITSNGVRAYWLGQFEKWDSHRNADAAKAHGMFQECPSTANIWDHENLDNAMTGLHDHMMYRKYGYGRAAAQLSIDIRNGSRTRWEALKICEIVDGLFPYHYAGVELKEVLDHLSMSLDELVNIMGRFTNWNLFSRIDDNRPILIDADRRFGLDEKVFA